MHARLSHPCNWKLSTPCQSGGDVAKSGGVPVSVRSGVGLDTIVPALAARSTIQAEMLDTARPGNRPLE